MLILAAWLFVLIGYVWVTINAFKTSFWWGLGSLLILPIAFIFGLIHWSRNRTPMMLWIIGFVSLAILGTYGHQRVVYI